MGTVALRDDAFESAVDTTTGAPSRLLLLSEGPRVMCAFQRLLLAAPWLGTAPRGDGQPVLVLPGLLAGDSSTTILRSYLSLLGYKTYKWHLGRNVGPTAAVRAGLADTIARVSRRNRATVSVIGWSLGGIYARELAHSHPEQVRQVITLASPYRLRHPDQSRAHGAFVRYSHLHTVDPDSTEAVSALSHRRSALPVPVPSSSFYSRTDGIVSWQHCIEPQSDTAENVRTFTSHLGIGFDPHVLWAVADRLALPEGEMTPFAPPRLLAPLFPTPDDPGAPDDDR